MDSGKTSIADRLAVSLVSAIVGLVTATLIWIVVAISTEEIGFRPPAFLFSSMAFAVAGFLLSTTMADAIAAWVQALWAVANGFANNFDGDPGERPPLWTVFFLGAVVAVTAWLSIA